MGASPRRLGRPLGFFCTLALQRTLQRLGSSFPCLDGQKERGQGVRAISTAHDGRCCCDRGGHRPQKHRKPARAQMMSQGAGAYQCAAHSRRRGGRRERQKEWNQRSRWHNQPDVCFNWFRSRWVYSTLLVQILMGKLPEQPRVGIPSMSAGSGDGEAKSEVEESLPVLRWRLYAGQGFDLTG